jgi:hypothetical protein
MADDKYTISDLEKADSRGARELEYNKKTMASVQRSLIDRDNSRARDVADKEVGRLYLQGRQKAASAHGTTQAKANKEHDIIRKERGN